MTKLPSSLTDQLTGAANFTIPQTMVSQIDFGKIPEGRMDPDRIRIDFFDRLKEQMPETSATVLSGDDAQHPTYQKFSFVFAKPVAGAIASDIIEGVMEEEWKRAGFKPRDFDPQVTLHLDNSPQSRKKPSRGHRLG